MAIPSQYTTQIGEMKKANAGWDDQQAYDWGQKYYGWDANGTGGTSGSSSTSGSSGTSTWGNLSNYSDTYNFTPDTAPVYEGATFGTVAAPAPAWNDPGAFTYDKFTGPDAAALYADPSYKFRLQEGLNATQAKGAAMGMARTGNQQRALTDYASNLASTEYDKAYTRAQQDYTTNFNAARSAYDSSYQRSRDSYNAARDTFGDARQERTDAYNAATDTAKAGYQSKVLDWQAKQLAKEANASKSFDRGFDVWRYQNDDAYRRWADGLSDSYRTRSLNQNDAQFYADLEESRRRFLVSTGAGLA